MLLAESTRLLLEKHTRKCKFREVFNSLDFYFMVEINMCHTFKLPCEDGSENVWITPSFSLLPENIRT
jgi:hypothetical protein